MAEFIDVPAGLAGVAVADTEVGDVLGEQGLYHYRGRSAPDLARSTTFEHAAAVLLDGSDQPLVLNRRLPDGFGEIAARLDLRSAMSALGRALGLRPLLDADPEQRRNDALLLIGALPTLVATVRHGEPVEPDPSVGHVADYGRMLTGIELSPEVARALEAYMVLTLDHGFSNSSFATRVVASAGSDLAACVLAGYGSLTGPRHGANLERMLDMYDAIGTVDRAEEWMKNEVASRRRLQGFGHAVYRTEDPRLALLREHGAAIAPERHELVMAIERIGQDVLGGKRLVPNLDLHAAVVLEGCGVPREWFTATFATARVVGWCAHALEQATSDKILRPAARYIGPPPEVGEY